MLKFFNVSRMLMAKAPKIWSDLESFFKKLDESIEETTPPIPQNVIFKEMEFLKKATLIEEIKKTVTPESNGVAALLKKTEKNAFVYTALLIDEDFIEQERNKYLIIKCEGVARDVEELFGENELIILK